MRALVIVFAVFEIVSPVFAFAEQRPKVSDSGRVQGVFCPARAIQPCPRSCAGWAKSQPDFQFSYDACVAICRKQFQC
jgi:hypothetical protein